MCSHGNTGNRFAAPEISIAASPCRCAGTIPAARPLASALLLLLYGGAAASLPTIGALALAFLAASSGDAMAQANALCSGSPTADCTDVGAGGIRYTSGVDTVRVRDGVAGATVVNSGTAGILLSRSGVNGASAPDVEFQTIAWDTDGDADTPDVDVVSQDGITPHLVNGEFISVVEYDAGGDPKTFRIGTDTFTGMSLVQYLAANASDIGAAISGSLTIDNNAGPGSQGASFTTTNAAGISVSSTGGNGGNGGCGTILLYSWCDDGSRGGNAGSVAVNSNGTIVVSGDSPEKHGVVAISQGGKGGNGGGFFGLFASTPGGGGNGGNGAAVFVTLGPQSDITTHGDKSHGVFAQSRGGNGGSGGNASGLVALGSDGGNGGNAGTVLVANEGTILTTGWNAHGVLARSVGAGAGSGSTSGGLYAEGGNGGGQSSGAAVTVNNSGRITTENSDAFGILAQSIGGGGGDGGGAGGWFTVGGRAGSGGGSGVVSVFDSGAVSTTGDRSTAIFAQSVGGGGGNGGDAVSIGGLISVAVGGAGGLGGHGDQVHVVADGSDIDTEGDAAHGIHAQSVGGGGGNGGLAVSGTAPGSAPYNISVGLGGNGGVGGNAGALVEVETRSGTTIDTVGAAAYGIIAQSIGGGGGNGAMSLAGSGGAGLSVSVAIGGKGGVAGAGKDVNVQNSATITTAGDLSAGIFTQSIGGGGGNGGFAGTLAVGGSSASVSLGGSGGSGGAAGRVDVDNFGTIETHGASAAGIFAQSIGGGGGNGGSALAGSIGLASVSTTVGGRGGAGNFGGEVDILNAGLIRTRGNNSAGIFAQSVGGGGGSGGDATSLSLAGPVAVAVAVGGSGGAGGNGGKVVVENAGRIEAEGPNSDGIFAQSVGGSGGAGGSATTGTLVFPIEIEGVEIPAISANVSVGGRGAGGGAAGEVEVTHSGWIVTSGFLSNGVFAQSVGGSGGKGGHATNISIAFDAVFTGKVAVGGSGGQGGVGNKVTVDTSGLIHTRGDFSNGVFAQSVGGGGGAGGNATNVSLSLTPPPTSPEDFIPTPSANFDLALGGNGGSGAIGGEVIVGNRGKIVTEGHFAAGVMAQSVGGAGGFGGDARSIQVELTADPMDFLPLTSLTSLDLTLVVGGTGGSGSHGGAVTVANEGDVTTTGAFAHGIVAQSVGGGGGSGGSAMTFEFSNADLVPEIPVLDEISGLTTIEMTLQGSGGAGGDGGLATVVSAGNISTSGAFAMGIVAQSVAGGGGLAGFYNPHGITGNQIADSLFNTFVDTEAGLSFAGSVGGAGSARTVTVDHTGSIVTLGDGAHGIFAQSAAGQGSAAGIVIALDGSIGASGKDAHGIFAHSAGGHGSGTISVEIKAGGIVQGGVGAGAGVRLLGGAGNSITNHGSIWALSGTAIQGGDSADTVRNHGTVAGSVLLGAGTNAFINESGARFDAGATVAIGAGNTLTNHGVLAPGGQGAAQVTALTGNLVQAPGGVLAMDLSLRGLAGDRLSITGSASLDGALRLDLGDGSYAVPGTHRQVLVAASDGVTAAGLSLLAGRSAVLAHVLSFPTANEVAVSTRVDFAPAGMDANARRTGEHVNAILSAGGSASFAPVAAALIEQPDLAQLETAYEMLQPGAVGNTSGLSTAASIQFNDAMHSCRQRDGDFRFLREGECNWVQLAGAVREQRRTSRNSGYDLETTSFAGGIQRALDSDLHFGVGLSYQQSRLDARFSDVDGERFEAGVIVKRRLDATRLSGSLSVGYGRYDSARRIALGPLGLVARGHHTLWSASAHARFSHDLLHGESVYMRPMLSVGLTHVERSGFKEKGAGGANLDVDRANHTAVTLQPAFEVGAERSMHDATRMRPYLRLGLTQHLTGNDRRITATVMGTPDGVGSFAVTNRADRTYADLGLGLDLIRPNGVTMRLDYAGQFSRSSTAHAVGMKLSLPF